MKKFSVVLFALFFFISCHKDGNSFVEGTILAEGFETPVPDAYVSVMAAHNHNQEQYVQSQKTDENGHFKVYYLRRPGYEYSVMIEREKYTNKSFDNILRKRKASITGYLTVPKFIRFIIKNNLSSDITVGFPNDYTTIEAKANTTFLASYSMQINKYASIDLQWYYKIPSQNLSSAIMSETLDLRVTSDTLYRTLEIN